MVIIEPLSSIVTLTDTHDNLFLKANKAYVSKLNAQLKLTISRSPLVSAVAQWTVESFLIACAGMIMSDRMFKVETSA